jgi:hypothetical protein
MATRSRAASEGISSVFPPGSPPEFAYSFAINVPALDNYRYHLLTVEHAMHLYPATIEYAPAREKSVARSEKEFIDVLGNLLQRRETKRIIEALLAQIEQ